MCSSCDYDSNHCEIFQDGLTGDWYLDHQTNEWDSYDDGFVHDRIYIQFCPWCGRKLPRKGEVEDEMSTSNM